MKEFLFLSRLLVLALIPGERCFSQRIIQFDRSPVTNVVTFLSRAPTQRPLYSELAILRPADRPALSMSFKQASLTNKIRAAWGLAHLGNEEDLKLLREPLEHDYRGTALSPEETLKLMDLLKCIGYLARNSDGAFEYLESSLSPETWRTRIKWKLSPEMHTPAEIWMARGAIHALGFTARQSAMTALEGLAAADKLWLKDVASSVTEAVFCLWTINEEGQDTFMRIELSGSDDTLSRFRRFKRTAVGKSWTGWSSAKMGIPQGPNNQGP